MIDYSTKAFIIHTPEGGYIAVNQEFVPEGGSICPTNRYHLYFVDPLLGSFTFYIECDHHGCWTSDSHPAFINQSNIDIIGHEIEAFND